MAVGQTIAAAFGGLVFPWLFLIGFGAIASFAALRAGWHRRDGARRLATFAALAFAGGAAGALALGLRPSLAGAPALVLGGESLA